jgi:hypothetical protein
MKKTQLQIVSFEQARKLKELGFDWWLSKAYTDDGELCAGSYIPGNHNKMDDYLSAPTVALALKWFRDVKQLRNGIIYEKGYYLDQSDKAMYRAEAKFEIGSYCSTGFRTYEDDENALLDALIMHCLEEYV